jgi:hypothetical protein
LNRGFTKPKRNGDKGILQPDCYIFPLKYINTWKAGRSHWGKITKSKLLGHAEYKNRWDLIAKFLKKI